MELSQAETAQIRTRLEAFSQRIACIHAEARRIARGGGKEQEEGGEVEVVDTREGEVIEAELRSLQGELRRRRAVGLGMDPAEQVAACLRDLADARTALDRAVRQRELMGDGRFRRDVSAQQASLEERATLARCQKELEGVTGVGAAALDALRRQRDTMEGTRQRLLGIIGGLGTSSSLLGEICRRHWEDKWMWRLLVLAVLAALALVWWWKRGA